VTPASTARRFLRGRHDGALATLSHKLCGYPFGSTVPFLLDQEARPIIFISALAEHTKNIAHDPRVSLLAQQETGDPQAGARLTLVGDAARLEDQHSPRAPWARYFPDAAQQLELPDFAFYRIEPKHIRFIGGFGAIHWISSSDFRSPDNLLGAAEEGIVAHMNQEHAQNLRDYCLQYHGAEVLDVQMLGIDCDGFDVRAEERLLRFEFTKPVLDAQQAREALVAMAKASKG